MKKILIILIVLILVLIIPVPLGSYNDGGTRDYFSLTYRIVDWNKLVDDGKGIYTYKNTCIYFFPDNFKKIDELWDIRH